MTPEAAAINGEQRHDYGTGITRKLNDDFTSKSPSYKGINNVISSLFSSRKPAHRLLAISSALTINCAGGDKRHPANVNAI